MYCSLICLTESWLKEGIPDPSLTGFSTIRSDRNEASSKERGGGVCMFINDKWCNNISVKERLCDVNMELLVVSLRPFYLPREYNNVFVILAYITTDANYTDAAEKIAEIIDN